MAKERTGSLYRDERGRWVARITYVDETGRRRQKRRVFGTKTEAREELWRLRRSLSESGADALASDRKTFAELADHYERTYLVPAVYVDGRKVAGRRSLSNIPGQMAALREFFGRKRLRSITHGDLERFRAARLQTPTRAGRPRSIATVNRELALLRAMLNMARREGWIQRNPFNAGPPLIRLADERSRERVLTRDEEDRLLSACAGRCAHLRPVIIAALDTGCRRGELFALRWRDVDFAAKTIRIQAFNTKTQRERIVAMTGRLESALWELYQGPGADPEARVFGIADNVKNSFHTVRRKAGIESLRFHDLRHTAATRMVRMGLPLQEVGRTLGHTQARTTYRYVNATVETAKRAAAALDAFNAETAATGAELVN